jgi:non-heme chloroperoxidase
MNVGKTKVSIGLSAGTIRRELMIAGAGFVLALPATAMAPTTPRPATQSSHNDGRMTMSTITTTDSIGIYCKGWGTGQPIVFHHGWPLSGGDRDAQMLFFPSKGYRVIAHDRCGHGRSSQTDAGNEMDTYAADVAAMLAHLGLQNAVRIGIRRAVARWSVTLRAMAAMTASPGPF